MQDGDKSCSQISELTKACLPLGLVSSTGFNSSSITSALSSPLQAHAHMTDSTLPLACLSIYPTLYVAICMDIHAWTHMHAAMVIEYYTLQYMALCMWLTL